MLPNSLKKETEPRMIKSQIQNPSENPIPCQETQPKSPQNLGKIKGSDDQNIPIFKQESESPNLEEEEEEEGYRTPTSPEHRIPAITQCPPAPKRCRPHWSRLERKLASPAVRRRLQFDAAAEFVFWRVNRDKVVEKKIKKTRTNDDDGV